jgi:ABC-2 type transport system permease protein
MSTVATIPFSRLLRAECRKATDTLAARWLLAAAVALALAAQAIPLAFPHEVTQDRASFLTWAGLGLTRLLPVALMLTMTAEWSQRTALATFTVESRRGRVLAAKVLAAVAITIVGGSLAFGIAQAGLAVATVAGHHPAGGWSGPELAGFAAFLLCTSGVGIAVGSAVHNTAAAVVTYFALAALTSLLLIPAVAKVGTYANPSQTFGWVLTGNWPGHGPQIASSAAIWIALPLAIGTVRTLRRDVR